MITILCPTKGRPESCKKMVESAIATAASPPEILLGVAEPYSSYEAIDIDGASLFRCGVFPTVHVVNELAKIAKGNLLYVVGDDAVFTTPHWDTALEKHYQALANKIHVFSLLDSRGEDGTPHPIVTRECMEALGYFYPPIFNHFYADTWIVDIAKANNCFTHLKDYMLAHNKPSDKGIYDDTYRHIRGSGWLTRDRAVDESCAHFLEVEKKRLAQHILKGTI